MLNNNFHYIATLGRSDMACVANPNPHEEDSSPIASIVSPITETDSNIAKELCASPLAVEEDASPREKRNMRPPLWMKDYYAK